MLTKLRPGAGVVVIEHERERKYLPGLADLIDRLTIVNQKMVFLPNNRQEYHEERELLIHDIDMLLEDLSKEGVRVSGQAVLAITMIALTNRFIWENESKARAGGDDQDKLLKLTHSINGVRNTSKNVLASEMGGRHDYKIDCFAESLVSEFGNWNVFDRD